MIFELNEVERGLQDTLARVLQRSAASPANSHTGAGRESLWRDLADIGLLSLPFTESDGGLGGSPEQLMLAMHEIGRSAARTPFVSSVIHAGSVIAGLADADRRRRLLNGLIDGSACFATAAGLWPGPSTTRLQAAKVRAVRSGEAWVLNGEVPLVCGGDTADSLLVEAHVQPDFNPRDAAVFLVPVGHPDVSRATYSFNDGSGVADVRLDGAELPADALLLDASQAPGVIRAASQNAIVALVSEAVGLMERMHQLTVEYLKTRKQFGMVLGGFQAVSHLAVDMLVMLEQSRSMAMHAVAGLQLEDPAATTRAVSAAKVFIGRTGRLHAQHAIQLHGGIGMTEEYAIGAMARRLWAIDLMFGDSEHHLNQLASLPPFGPSNHISGVDQ